MLTQNAVIKIVENYAQEIEAQGIHLRIVILYGSFAKGTQHEWSDIDVALVADEFTGLPTDHRLFPFVGIKKPYIRIEAVTYPTDYFRAGDPFIEEIKKDGIVILDKNINNQKSVII
jgi:predicted nucleotidyltransferase